MIKLKNILLESLGDCYQAGANLISGLGKPAGISDDAKLVHGMVAGQGQLDGVRFGHCWVEDGDTVYDHSNGRKLDIPKPVYYAIGQIDPKECYYYTKQEAVKFMVDTGHYGPWEMTGATVIAEEMPDRKPEIGKRKQRINPSDLEDMESILALGEKFASKAQQRFMFATDPKAAKKLASKMTKKDYDELPDKVREVDYHSKLSRGHKPDYYQLGTSDFKPFDKSEDDVEENFADGKKKGRKGLSKRVGVSQKMSISKLAKIAKTASGERKRMAQWNLNMKRGRKKKK
jgi:hypothetical protein